MDKFSNKDVQRIAGLSHRQVVYLSEKGIVAPELEDASGRGTTRWYSRRDMAKFLVAKALRDAGMDFPALGVITALLGGFYDELDKLLEGDRSRTAPTVVNLVDGRFCFLSPATGTPRTKVAELTAQGRVKLSELTAAQALKAARVVVTIHLDRVISILEGE